ncbi:MAG: type II toxin-antitoxin system VapC family toxin [Candidatus Riflebacteria bacterium]|nr:type II toxin-antitoxin system VapC family toxin [Candidatus Riflebacteria bacterium]
MGLLIDASFFIAQERGQLDLGSGAIGRPNETLLVSAITASELLHGVHRAQTPLQAKRRAAFVEAILDRFPVLEVDLKAARIHAQLWAELAKKGIAIGMHDLWIGAQAVTLGYGVLTANERDFRRIPGLEVHAVNQV